MTPKINILCNVHELKDIIILIRREIERLRGIIKSKTETDHDRIISKIRIEQWRRYKAKLIKYVAKAYE
jgi:hypothetical protein